jgi:hypothetical protein
MINFVPTAYELYFPKDPIATQKLEELERAFFSALRLRNGTFKLTYPHRLDDLNALATPYLPSDRPLMIMDVAVSSGISTLEWTATLDNAGITHHMVAGDMTIDAFLVNVGPWLRVLVDKAGHALQFDVGGRAISRKRDQLFRLPCIVVLKIASRLVRSKFIHQAQAGHWYGITWRSLQLVSISLRRLSSIEVIEDDILGKGRFIHAFHVVRAANILNRSYFSESVLMTMIQNLRSRLKPGGLLIICRTGDKNINNATLFTLGLDGSFGVLARLNEGSEVEELVLRVPRFSLT